jgi:hypothetical protein
MATTIQVNKIIDVDKLKYEIEYSGDFKVTGILPKTLFYRCSNFSSRCFYFSRS